MADIISFESTSPRFGLPLLFAGQAQKELFVNEALSMIDGLLHCAIEDLAAIPPTTPAVGASWLVAPGAIGPWTGRDGQIALHQNGQWLFAEPRDGMRVLNKATGQDLRRANAAWIGVVAPAVATGGAVIDTEVRASLASLIDALRQAGVFAA